MDNCYFSVTSKILFCFLLETTEIIITQILLQITYKMLLLGKTLKCSLEKDPAYQKQNKVIIRYKVSLFDA